MFRSGTGNQSQDLGLTARQSYVLKLLVEGKQNKINCSDLGL